MISPTPPVFDPTAELPPAPAVVPSTPFAIRSDTHAICRQEEPITVLPVVNVVGFVGGVQPDGTVIVGNETAIVPAPVAATCVVAITAQYEVAPNVTLTDCAGLKPVRSATVNVNAPVVNVTGAVNVVLPGITAKTSSITTVITYDHVSLSVLGT